MNGTALSYACFSLFLYWLVVSVGVLPPILHLLFFLQILSKPLSLKDNQSCQNESTGLLPTVNSLLPISQ